MLGQPRKNSVQVLTSWRSLLIFRSRPTPFESSRFLANVNSSGSKECPPAPLVFNISPRRGLSHSLLCTATFCLHCAGRSAAVNGRDDCRRKRTGKGGVRSEHWMMFHPFGVITRFSSSLATIIPSLRDWKFAGKLTRKPGLEWETQNSCQRQVVGFGLCVEPFGLGVGMRSARDHQQITAKAGSQLGGSGGRSYLGTVWSQTGSSEANREGVL